MDVSNCGADAWRCGTTGYNVARTTCLPIRQGYVPVAKLPRVIGAQLVRALRRAGWHGDHQTGSHLFLRHPARPGTVTVPMHAGRIIKPGTLQSILDQAGPEADELRDLL